MHPSKSPPVYSDRGIPALFFFATLTSHISPKFSNACACILLQPDCHACTLDSHDVRSLALSHWTPLSCTNLCLKDFHRPSVTTPPHHNHQQGSYTLLSRCAANIHGDITRPGVAESQPSGAPQAICLPNTLHWTEWLRKRATMATLLFLPQSPLYVKKMLVLGSAWSGPIAWT